MRTWMLVVLVAAAGCGGDAVCEEERDGLTVDLTGQNVNPRDHYVQGTIDGTQSYFLGQIDDTDYRDQLIDVPVGDNLLSIQFDGDLHVQLRDASGAIVGPVMLTVEVFEGPDQLGFERLEPAYDEVCPGVIRAVEQMTLSPPP